MKLPAVNSTPVGAAAQAGAVVTIIMELLRLWPWWAHQPAAFPDAVQTVLTGAAAYMAGYFKVVLAKGQSVHMTLTSSPLPTVQAVAAPPQQ